DALVPAIEQIGPPFVGSVEDGVHEAARFLTPRAGLYASTAELAELRDEVDARFDYEVSKRAGASFDETPPPPLDVAAMKRRLGAVNAQRDRFPDGYYQSADGRTIVVAIRSKVPSTDFKKGSEALRRVREAVERTNLASFDPTITVGY